MGAVPHPFSRPKLTAILLALKYSPVDEDLTLLPTHSKLDEQMPCRVTAADADRHGGELGLGCN